MYYHYMGRNPAVPPVFFIYVVIYKQRNIEKIIVKDIHRQVYMIPYSLWLNLELETEADVIRRNSA